MKRIITSLAFAMMIVVNVNAQDLHYIAVVLDSVSQRTLAHYAIDAMPWGDYKLFCHHMTVAHHTNVTDELMRWAEKHEGEEYELRVKSVGWSDKAFAVKVEHVHVPCVNEHPHVTLATHPSADGKAVDSNYISNWHSMKDAKKMKEMLLKGRVTIFWK